jgi:hypothetical protein
LLDPSTLDELNEALGQAIADERMLKSAQCTVQTRASLGSEGLLGVTSTRVLFVARDSLHGTQIDNWGRGAVTEAVLRTDLFGPKLTLRTDAGDEIVASGFADQSDADALLALLGRDLGEATPTTIPPPTEDFFADRDLPAEAPGRPTPPARNSATTLMLVVAGALAALGLVGGVVFVLLLAPTPAPPQPPVSAKEVVPLPPAPALPAPPAPLGATTVDPAAPLPDEAGLDAETVGRVIERASLASCVSDAVDRGAGFEGNLTLTILIQPDGRVAATGVDGSTAVDDELSACITGRLTRLRFPAFEGHEAQNVSWVLRIAH